MRDKMIPLTVVAADPKKQSRRIVTRADMPIKQRDVFILFPTYLPAANLPTSKATRTTEINIKVEVTIKAIWFDAVIS